MVALRNVCGFLRLKRDKCPKFQGYHTIFIRLNVAGVQTSPTTKEVGHVG